MEKLKHTKGPFTVRQTSTKGFSLIQWDFFGFPPTPQRSIQVETDLAELWVNAPSTPHLCSDPTCPGDINRKKLELFDRYKKALEDLTPGGSEYVDDPERCVATIWEKIAGPITILKRQAAKLQAAEEMAKGLRWLRNENDRKKISR